MASIVIVGAGIVGLSVARAGTRRGHEITVLDAGPVPNPHGASFDQHRMIRPHYGAAEGYTRMVAEAFPIWEVLWRELGACHFADSGAATISTAAGDYGCQTEAMFRRLGVPHDVLTGAALEERFSHLELPPGSRGIVAHPAGPLFADRIVTDLAGLCVANSVRILPHTPVATVEDGAVRTANGDRLAGDFVVVCAGAWLPALMPARFGHLPTWRQALCYAEPPEQHRRNWQTAPAIVTIGGGGGYTLPPLAGTGLKFGSGGHRRRSAPDTGFGWDIAEGRQVLDAFRPFLRDADAYAPLRMQVGYYVMNAARHFVIETMGRCLFITNCDGQMFKFGPLIGEKVLATFTGEMSASELTDWAAGHRHGAGSDAPKLDMLEPRIIPL
jgi:sarcosine oxidase